MNTRMNVYGQRGVLNLRPCIKMLQQNGRWPLGRHWRSQIKNKRFNIRIIINVVFSTAINNRQQRNRYNFLHRTRWYGQSTDRDRHTYSVREGDSASWLDKESCNKWDMHREKEIEHYNRAQSSNGAGKLWISQVLNYLHSRLRTLNKWNIGEVNSNDNYT